MDVLLLVDMFIGLNVSPLPPVYGSPASRMFIPTESIEQFFIALDIAVEIADGNNLVLSKSSYGFFNKEKTGDPARCTCLSRT